jgi:hypothetical protein
MTIRERHPGVTPSDSPTAGEPMNVPGASHPDTTDPAFPGQAVSRLREDGLAIFSGFRDRASLAEAARSVMAARAP